MDDAVFRGYVLNALRHRPPSSALKYAASLLDFMDIVQFLLEFYVKSKEEAFSFAKKILLFDPRFDVALLDWLREGDVGSRSDEIALIVLDILDAVSERDRLVLGVSRFMKHSHARLRSKAALFIARRRPNLTWVQDLSSESDARVRANIIESLFAVKDELVISLFRRHVSDEDNRTAGNALLGLYRAGDPASIPLIYEMARDTRPQFRNTSAWVMGQTGDPQFSQTLAAQLSDEDEVVRKQALNGLREIKNALKSARERNLFLVAILRYQSEETGHSLVCTICKTNAEIVPGLPAEKFFLKAGGKPVQNFRVEEYVCKTPINASFVFCLPADKDQAVSAEFDAAMKRCSGMRRADDTFSASKLMHEAQLNCCSGEPDSSGSLFKNALPDVDFSAPHRHLIVVGGNSEMRVIDALLELGINSGATVHVIALAPEWKQPTVKQRIEEAGGFFRSIDKQNDLAQACLESYVVLLQHYLLKWESGEGNPELEIHAESGGGLATYQPLAA